MKNRLGRVVQVGFLACALLSVMSCTRSAPPPLTTPTSAHSTPTLEAQAISNVAQGKAASASSITSGYDASVAVDGDINTIWSSAGTVSLHSWQVDLGQAYVLSSVEVVHRQNIDQPETRRNYEIRASNNASMSGYVVLGSQGSSSLPHAATKTVSVSNTTAFRYVAVVKTVADYFTLAEVRVLADTNPPPPPSTTNLAQGKTATASSITSGYDASVAVDGNVGTIWSSAGTLALHSWQVDLGQAYVLGSIEVVHRQNIDQPETRRNYEIRASNNADMSSSVVLGSQGSSSLPHAATKTIAVTNATAYRYVSVTKTVGEYFTLAEVRVFGNGGTPPPPPPPSTTNVAQGKTASASSIWDVAYDASKAVDGDISTLWSSAGTVSLHSWQVDLGQAYVLSSIEVVHRQNIDQPETRRNYEVRASNNADMSGSVVLGSQGSSSLAHAATKTIAVTNTTAYRYVAVVKTVADYFTLAEVRVFGSGGTQPPPTGGTASIFASPGGSGTACSSGSPCSLAQAQLNARASSGNLSSNLVVELAGGVYQLGSTMNFTASDSGTNGYSVIYRAATNATVRISGGEAVTGWTNTGNNIWKANVGSKRFRQLYVDSAPTVRARTPNVGNYYRLTSWDAGTRAINIDAGQIGNWQRIGELEMVINRHWSQHRLRVTPSTVTTAEVARNKTASASSIYGGGYEASRAVDGDSGTFWSSEGTAAQHSWQVDLGQAYVLSSIDLVPRQNQDQPETRRNFEIRASNNASMSGYVVLGSQGSSSFPNATTRTFPVTNTNAYRYLSVNKTANEYFTIAEVRAITNAGTPVQNPTLVTPQEPERTRSLDLPFPPADNAQAYFFENALELLDSPGEWYLNTSSNEVFYMPRANENMSSVSVVAPKLEVLFNVEGTLSSPVHHLQFQRLIFENSTWMRPSSEGFVGWQAGGFIVGPGNQAEFQPGGVRVSAAKNIVFERNTFRNMGANGLNFYGGVQDSQIIGNFFNDLSGQGMAIDADAVKNPADARAIVQNISIKNNRVTRIGLDYSGSVGIQASYLKNSEILHNQVWDTPYTGISVGWGWTSDVTSLGGVNTSYNHIYNVMNLHDDGGGIYTWSNQQPGSLVSENYIHDISKSPWAGGFGVAAIYIDQQGSNITIRDNVLQSLGGGITPVFLQPCCGGVTGITNTNNGGASASVISNAGPEAGY